MNNRIDVVIGCTVGHLLYSVRNRIPIILTSYEIFEFEGIPVQPTIENSLISGTELNIFKKSPSYSSREIFEKLLFIAEIRGLIVDKEVFRISFNSDERKIMTFNKNNISKTILYKKVYILDTSVISYLQSTIISGNFSYTVFDFFKNNKSARIFLNIDKEWIKEVYFFDDNVIIKHIVDADKLDEWEFSCVSSRLTIEEMLMNKFSTNNLELRFVERKTRQNWKNVLGTKQGIFEFYDIPD